MLKMTRRTFLKVSAGTSAAVMAALTLLRAMENDLGGRDICPVTGTERKAIPTNCHVCNIQDGAMAFVGNGRIVKLEGNPEHVSTRGRLCAKGNAGMWYSYDPDRILYRLKRVGERGEGKWKRISWDEAYNEIAARLDDVLKNGHPNEIMLKWGRKRTGGVLDRFMHTLDSARDLLKTAVRTRLKKLGIDMTIASKDIGYELRCADPIPFDLEYTRDLGYCATKYLLSGGNAAMISMQAGKFVPVPFRDLIDPVTGRAKIRMVDVRSTRYAIARRYMIRLRRDDFDEPLRLSKIAETAGMSVGDFRKEFQYLIDSELPPIVFRIDVQRPWWPTIPVRRY